MKSNRAPNGSNNVLPNLCGECWPRLRNKRQIGVLRPNFA